MIGLLIYILLCILGMIIIDKRIEKEYEIFFKEFKK
jgi:hypothetical protein